MGDRVEYIGSGKYKGWEIQGLGRGGNTRSGKQREYEIQEVEDIRSIKRKE